VRRERSHIQLASKGRATAQRSTDKKGAPQGRHLAGLKAPGGVTPVRPHHTTLTDVLLGILSTSSVVVGIGLTEKQS